MIWTLTKPGVLLQPQNAVLLGLALSITAAVRFGTIEPSCGGKCPDGEAREDRIYTPQ